MSDKSWEPEHFLTHSLTLSLSHSFTLLFTHSQHAEQLSFSCLCSKVALSLSHSLTLSLFHSSTLALLHSRTLTLSHSLIHSLSTCWTTFVFMSRLKSHSLTFTLSHSHTLSFSHSLSLDMLNNFCFHVYAHKSLFIRKLQWNFLGPRHPHLWV